MNADTENTKDKNPTQFENTDNEAPAEELGKDTASLTQEVSDLKDKYMRAVAEMENMRRRMERERGELIKKRGELQRKSDTKERHPVTKQDDGA